MPGLRVRVEPKIKTGSVFHPERMSRMQKPEVEYGKKMKVNQFDISDKMSAEKHDLPEWTWDDIIKLGLKAAKVFSNEDNQLKYKQLYWFAQKNVSELIATLM